ncbi:hypothetical protein Hanom_Chr15g01338421 [Helianthus anomalus]
MGLTSESNQTKHKERRTYNIITKEIQAIITHSSFPRFREPSFISFTLKLLNRPLE